MYTLHYKRKKDKAPFSERWDMEHKGHDTNLTIPIQKEAMQIVSDELAPILAKLEKLGYDKQTAKFSIKEKKQ